MPETIGLLVLASVGAIGPFGALTGTAATIVATVIGTAVLVGGSYALQLAFAPDAPTTKPSDGQIVTRQPLPPRRRSYGRVKIGGCLVFSEVAFGHRMQVIAVNQGVVDAFEEIWLGDTRCELGDDGAVTNAFIHDSFPFVFVWYETGAPGVHPVNGAVSSQFPDLWTSSHLGIEVAKVAIRMAQPDAEDFTTVYPGAQHPPFRAVLRGAKIWDPRFPAQHKDDPNTWTWSENPVLQVLDFHRHADGMNMAHFDNVFFTPAAIAEDWIPTANICDEAIPLAAGGTEARYRGAGSYDLPGAAPKDVLGVMLASCDGQTYQRPDGAIGIRVGKTIAPTVTINDRHIKGYDSFRKGISALTGINEIAAQYLSPEHDYQETDAQPWRDEASISETGQVTSEQIRLLWVPSHSQCRRLMKLEMRRRNPEWTGRIITDLYGLHAYNERYVRLQIGELGINGTFEIIGFTIDVASALCTIEVTALDQSAFAWSTSEEAVATPLPPVGEGQSTIDPPAGLVTDVINRSGVGLIITMSWEPSLRTDAVAEAQYKLTSAPGSSYLSIPVAESDVYAETPGLTAGVDYDVRVAWRVGSRYSAWTEQTGIDAAVLMLAET